MKPLNEYITGNVFEGYGGLGVNESILSDPDLTVSRSVEINDILKKHYCATSLKKADWDGNTLRLIYDGYGYLYELQDLMDELSCKSICVYPQIVIRETPVLDGLSIKCATRCQVSGSIVKNCLFEDGAWTYRTSRMGISFTAPKNGFLEISDTTIKSAYLKFANVERAKLLRNNFDDVERLTLTYVGKMIQKIVEKWNLCTIKDGEIKTYPYPAGQFDPNMDPLKALGLDKHFKNLTQLQIATKTGGDKNYILFEKNTSRKATDFEVTTYKPMNNGWTAMIVHCANML